MHPFMKNIEYEIVQNSKWNSFNVTEMICKYFPRQMHYHPEHELVFIYQGHGLCFAGDGVIPMKPKHIYFISSGLPHFFRSDNIYYDENYEELCHSCYTQFKDSILPGDYKNMIGCKNIYRLINAGENGIEWDLTAYPQIQTSVNDLIKSRGFERLQLLYKILNQLGNMVDKFR